MSRKSLALDGGMARVDGGNDKPYFSSLPSLVLSLAAKVLQQAEENPELQDKKHAAIIERWMLSLYKEAVRRR